MCQKQNRYGQVQQRTGAGSFQAGSLTNGVEQQVPVTIRAMSPHIIHGQKLKVSVWLTGTGVITRVEECEETISIASRPGRQTLVRLE